MGHSIDSIVDREIRRWEMESRILRPQGPYPERAPIAHPVVTVSYQHGTPGAEIAAGLADRLHYTLLHRDVIDRMSRSTDYSRRLLQTLDEHTKSRLAVWVESMLAGRFVDEHDYVRALLETVYSIARLGGVVVVGRGSNYIVGLERGYHLRVVAPRRERIEAVMRSSNVTARAALREIKSVDRPLSEFVRRVFGRAVDDPLGYDVVVNTSGAQVEALARWLAGGSALKFERIRPAEPIRR